jgi:hypothetical protein
MAYKPIFRHEIENGDVRIALFGGGATLTKICDTHISPEFILEKVVCVIDNDSTKQGENIAVRGYVLPCCSFEYFTEHFYDEKTVILLSLPFYTYREDVINQIDSYKNGVICWDMLRAVLSQPVRYRLNRDLSGLPQKIPKTIHYCWFGGKPIPPNLQVCIDSWSRFCPDYEIVRWDETNYDISKNAYMKKGHELGIWSLVSDYVRADVIHEHGGVYLDTDVELIRNIDDLLSNEAYYGFECGPQLNNGSGYGAVAGHDVVAEMLETLEYKNVVDSIPQKHTIFQMEILGTAMRKRGFRLDNTMQVKDGIALYPSDVFAPKTWIIPPQFIHITENTHSIHHYNVSYIKPLGELKGSVK